MSDGVMAELNPLLVEEIVRRALVEDLGTGDLTTQAVVEPGRLATGLVIAKAPGVIAGLPVAREVFRQLDPRVEFVASVGEGTVLADPEVPREVARIYGPARPILTGERVALNFLQHLCGVATLTRAVVEQLRGTGARLVDTRKTLPGLRALEKYAVRAGGGYNHRQGLYDAVLLKDNHLALAGGITAAVKAVRAQVGHVVRVEVEVEELAQLEEAIAAGADIVLLDNMPPEEMSEAVRMARGRCLLEASGGITLDNVAAVGRMGVDLVSLGALTHSAPALDLCLEVREA